MYISLFNVWLQNDFVVETTLVGWVMNGLSHLCQVKNKAEFSLALIKGLGGNLNEPTREVFAKEVCMQLKCPQYNMNHIIFILVSHLLMEMKIQGIFSSKV